MILLIGKYATPDEVKSAYRELVKRWHPDKVHDNNKRWAATIFQEITVAYKVLSDPDRRRNYDVYGVVDEDTEIVLGDDQLEEALEDIQDIKKESWAKQLKDGLKDIFFEENVVEVKTCPKCKGEGRITFDKGFFEVVKKCKDCKGEGTIEVPYEYGRNNGKTYYGNGSYGGNTKWW